MAVLRHAQVPLVHWVAPAPAGPSPTTVHAAMGLRQRLLSQPPWSVHAALSVARPQPPPPTASCVQVSRQISALPLNKQSALAAQGIEMLQVGAPAGGVPSLSVQIEMLSLVSVSWTSEHVKEVSVQLPAPVPPPPPPPSPAQSQMAVSMPSGQMRLSKNSSHTHWPFSQVELSLTKKQSKDSTHSLPPPPPPPPPSMVHSCRHTPTSLPLLSVAAMQTNPALQVSVSVHSTVPRGGSPVGSRQKSPGEIVVQAAV